MNSPQELADNLPSQPTLEEDPNYDRRKRCRTTSPRPDSIAADGQNDGSKAIETHDMSALSWHEQSHLAGTADNYEDAARQFIQGAEDGQKATKSTEVCQQVVAEEHGHRQPKAQEQPSRTVTQRPSPRSEHAAVLLPYAY